MSQGEEQFMVRPIGHVRCSRSKAIDDDWDAETATVELDTGRFGLDALAGLDAFSHVEVIYLFHKVDEAKVESSARRPRGNPNWPLVGIVAQRGKGRPNRLGATVCRVIGVDGTSLQVVGLDAIDGTPVLDLKPVMTGFLLRGDVTEPDWARELMVSYW